MRVSQVHLWKAHQVVALARRVAGQEVQRAVKVAARACSVRHHRPAIHFVTVARRHHGHVNFFQQAINLLDKVFSLRHVVLGFCWHPRLHMPLPQAYAGLSTTAR